MTSHGFPRGEATCSIDKDYNSPGLFNSENASDFLTFDLPRLHLQLAIIFTLTQALHGFLLRRIHLPRICSAILVGMLLGPTGLGRYKKFGDKLFPATGDIFLNYLSRIGYIFFIFLWGVKMDASMMLKAGWRPWIIGSSGGMLPLVIGQFVFLEVIGDVHYYVMVVISQLISAQAFISFPVVASILVDLRIINTELGHLALTSSLISNLLDISTTVFSTSIRHWNTEIRYPMMMQSFTLFGLFVVFIFSVVKPVSYWIIRQTPKKKQVRSMFIVTMSALLLASCLFSDNIGLNHEYGAFVVGLCVPDGPPLGSSLVSKLETLVEGLLVPLLISYCGAKTNLVEIYDFELLKYMYLAVAYCLVAQIISIVIPALCFKVPLRDALTLSFVLSSQGSVQVAMHLFAFNAEMYDTEIFSRMIFCVLLIASTMHILARKTYNYSFTYAGYQKRTIEHEGVDGELKILSCMYHFDDVYVMKKILEASIPDDKSPVSVSVIQLVELVGRANPQLIDHKVGQDAKYQTSSRSEEVFELFTVFENQYAGLADVHMFTGISMFKFMHQHICGLAFKKSVSMIILPFHIKWNHHGRVISDNNNLRTVNSNVLEIAPSSVAILIDRRKAQRSTQGSASPYRVVVIFIGGADDREALFYGKRMARSNAVHLTFVRILSSQLYIVENEWDNIMDTEALRALKVGGNYDIEFREEEVNDGADTTRLVHKIAKAFDLILVGRSHNEDIPQLSGLSGVTDYPELGSVGDILATSDISNPLTILVVQQQIKKR